MDVSIIGLDLAKNVFQVHGVNRDGKVVIRRQVRRNKLLDFFAGLPPCVVGMEACCSAHHWARQIKRLGHEVRLMPPHYVKPYVKRQKNDAADAEAICEAATRPSMRFVAIKGTEQQSVLVLHRTRSLLIRQRTMLVNALRSHFAEFGIVVAKGIENVVKLAAMVEDKAEGVLPAAAVTGLSIIAQQLKALKLGIDKLEKEIRRWHRKNPESRRLATIPGIGPITASAMSATIANPHQFKSGRHLAAWLGVVPRQNSSGGKERLGKISKQGDRYLRQLLVIGATSVLGVVSRKATANNAWVLALLEKKPPRLVTVALANKMARIVWAIMVRGETFKSKAA